MKMYLVIMTLHEMDKVLLPDYDMMVFLNCVINRKLTI
jgi:hypothetical protein